MESTQKYTWSALFMLTIYINNNNNNIINYYDSRVYKFIKDNNNSGNLSKNSELCKRQANVLGIKYLMKYKHRLRNVTNHNLFIINKEK